jgi:hypothetical protein
MKENSPLFLLTDFDARWKIAIEQMHQHFMFMFFPHLATRVNFNKPVRSLDKELQKIFADWDKKGWTAGDKLLEYELIDGSSHYVLIHIEAHGGDDEDFKKLQFTRFYRIIDRHPDKKLTQIVFYTGETVPPSPGKFVYEFEGTKNVHRFNVCIIKNQNRATLEKLSLTNPFALIILASLEHIATKNDADFRRRTKIRLIRLCLQSPFKEMIGHLLTFVEFTIALPAEERLIYMEELETLITQPMQGLKELYPFEVRNLEMLIWGKDIDERIDKAAEEKAIKIAEEKAIKIVEEILKESTLKLAREAEKKHILKMHELGIETDKIALILEVEQTYVLEIIEASQQQSIKPKRSTSKRKKTG